MTSSTQAYREATGSFAVVLRGFLLWAHSRKRNLLCAMEGQDHFYYDTRVRVAIAAVETSYFHMGGRSNVLQLLALSAHSVALKELRIAYFVDKDYAKPNVSSDFLYVTPVYAVENHYVTPNAIRRLLIAAFDVREMTQSGGQYVVGEELPRLLEFCSNVISDFCRTIGMQLNAFLRAAYLTAVESGGERHTLQTKLFDASKFCQLFEVTATGFRPKDELSYELLLQLFQAHPEAVLRQHYDTSLDEYQASDQVAVGRGKFLMIVLLKLYETLREDCRRARPRLFSKRRECKFSVAENPLAVMSAFADTPPELTEFLFRLQSAHRMLGQPCDAVAPAAQR